MSILLPMHTSKKVYVAMCVCLYILVHSYIHIHIYIEREVDIYTQDDRIGECY